MGLALVTTLIDGENGLDLGCINSDATVADLLLAMQGPADDPAVFKPYHKERYAPCAGCRYNCCKSNDITVDLFASIALAKRLNLSLEEFASQYLKLNADATYPEFKRRPCPFLQENLCTVYSDRALICRLYLCTPMGDRLEKVRGAVLFAGEAALRQRLVEMGLGPKSWQPKYMRDALRRRLLNGEIDRAAWLEEHEYLDLLIENNPFYKGKGYIDISIQSCCTEKTWGFIVGTPDGIS